MYDSAARSAEVLRLDVGDLDLANHRARVTRKGGAHDVIVWKSRTARLLSNYLAGRKDGPVFTTEQGAKSDALIGLGDRTSAAGRGCRTSGPKRSSGSGRRRCSERRRRMTRRTARRHRC